MFAVGELDHELIDRFPVAVLDDLHRNQVAAYRTDPAGHGTERARAVGELHSEQEGGHRPRLRLPREHFVSGVRHRHEAPRPRITC